MSGGVTRQRDELHAVNDRLLAIKPVPLAGLDVRRRNRSSTLEEGLRILRSLGRDLWRQPEVAFGLRYVDFGISKHAISVLSGETTNVVGMEVRDQNEVDLFRRVACAA